MSGAIEREAEALPEALPAGERVLWRGSPAWWPLACRAFHVRKVAIYFLILAGWRMLSMAADGASVAAIVTAGIWVLPISLFALGLLLLLAYLSSRTTVYTITSRRLVMRIGIALPITLNIPYSKIAAAAVTTDRAGVGDIPVAVGGKDRIAYMVLWPHARPWRLARPEPMLRAVPNALSVAKVLSDALGGFSVARGTASAVNLRPEVAVSAPLNHVAA